MADDIPLQEIVVHTPPTATLDEQLYGTTAQASPILPSFPRRINMNPGTSYSQRDLRTPEGVSMGGPCSGNTHSTHGRNPEIFEQTSNPSRVLVKDISLAKWGINFSGKECVREFFILVDENKEARDIPGSYIVRRFHELLSGSALKYFRSIRRESLTYTDLKKSFFRTFGLSNYDFLIERELRNKKQTLDESVQQFVIDVRDLNNKLTCPIPELALLDVIKYNLHPRYSPCLSTNLISNLDDLVRIGANFDTFNQPGNPVIAPLVNADPSLVCVKCNQMGHSYRLCPNIPGPICFKCRKPGFTSRFCPDCNQNNDQKN